MPFPPHAAGGGCDCLPRPSGAAAPDSDPPAARADPAPAPAFVLHYEDRWFAVEKRVAFDAPGLAAALAMIAHEPIGRWAVLSMDGAVVCRRGGEPGDAADYWVAD